jgi:hypothetical protein|tara:strand:- start:247 stop:516 length:270 start_codon:yes stop_codon:yes gene_type:complete
MKKIKLQKDGKGNELVPYVSSKNDRHEVVAPISSVHIGETSRQLVDSRQCVDYPRWVALYVGKSHKECVRWLDRYKKTVLRMCVLYEVS